MVGIGPIYHVAAVVADLEQAMRELTEAVGFAWHDPIAGTPTPAVPR